ncbi:MAG: glucose-6-phosphate isomerase [Firmicutes bacterium]|nr:glucose-6-phosphate isomerase [Bacillota bacterium]
MGERIMFDPRAALPFFREEELAALEPRVKQIHQQIHARTGVGSDFLGWVDLPLTYNREELAAIKNAAAQIKEQAEVMVVAGIGGSYLGARAAIEMLTPYFCSGAGETGAYPQVIFAGHHLSGTYLQELLHYLEDKEFCLNVISKSGTTTETAVAFRFLRKLAEEKYGKKGAASRIYATTDRQKGALRRMAEEAGYQTFTIPEDVGGRYSVLSPVGLFPMAVAGLDIEQILAGAGEAYQACSVAEPALNAAYQYALLRNLFYQKGKLVELMVSYEPALHYFTEWWKQLFGESEGKEGKGLFPAAVNFTSDLHSLGQYLQDGRRIFFETVLQVLRSKSTLALPAEEENLDGLNYLAGRQVDELNAQALQGTLLAHQDGGVPVLVLRIPELSAYYFGYLVYFFEKACAMSGYLLGVNPFNQPGVEEYKQNLFALLGKAGYEERRQRILTRLDNLEHHHK